MMTLTYVVERDAAPESDLSFTIDEILFILDDPENKDEVIEKCNRGDFDGQINIPFSLGVAKTRENGDMELGVEINFADLQKRLKLDIKEKFN